MLSPGRGFAHVGVDEDDDQGTVQGVQLGFAGDGVQLLGLPRIEPGVLEGGRDGAGVHTLRPTPYDAAADAGRVNRRTGRGDVWGEWTAGGAPGRPGRGHRRPQFVVWIRQRAAVRALYDGLPDLIQSSGIVTGDAG